MPSNSIPTSPLESHGSRRTLRWALGGGLVLIVIVLVTAGLLLGYRPGPAALNVKFDHYELRRDQTNDDGTPALAALLILSNTGPRQVRVDGVGLLSRYQFVVVHDRPTLSDSNGPLYPGESRPVSLWVKTNLPWRAQFNFRESSYTDYFPAPVRNLLPSRWLARRGTRILLTDPIDAYRPTETPASK